MSDNKGKDAAVERLRKLDTSAVSDAIDRLGLPGRVTDLPRVATEKRIAGRVLTVKLGPGPRAPGPTRHLCTGAVEAAGPGDVIVIENMSGTGAAGWGGILANAATVKGIGGAIVDGPARDIDECRGLGFPVFARSCVPTTARNRIVEEAFNEPVTISGVTVSPSDLVIADGSGMVFVRAADEERVLEAAEAIAAREAMMTKAVLAGEPVSKVMGADYEFMLDGNKD